MKKFILWMVRCILNLRYKVRIKGIDKILENKDKGILLLPNHPALMDPIIIMSYLFPFFNQRTIGDKDQINRPIIRLFARLFRMIPLPDPTKYGKRSRNEVDRIISKCGEVLNKGTNILIYPSGHILTSKYENVGGNSAVQTILKANPEARIVLVKTDGLWGSSWSRASGNYPSVSENIRKGIRFIIFNLIFFGPKRNITIELYEPEYFPRTESKLIMNRFIENFYNKDAMSNTYIPYYFFEKGKCRVVEEPKQIGFEGDIDLVSETVKELVFDFLKDLTGLSAVKITDRLSNDLGMDSLSRLEITSWIEKEFGFNVSNPDSLNTVQDVMLAASGQTIANTVKLMEKVNEKWFEAEGDQSGIEFIREGNITDIFTEVASNNISRPVVADQISGMKTFRDIITGIYVLRSVFEKIEGEYVGIMLPATVSACVVYFSALFAGKTPVMINWTVGERNMKHSLEVVGLDNIFTSKVLIEKLDEQGIKFGNVQEKFICLEDVGNSINIFKKVCALLRSYINPKGINRKNAAKYAAVLFTSGSESMPKAVPLTHRNLIENIGAVFDYVKIYKSDCLVGFLPPFHSFGLTVTMLLPILAGLRTVYHSNPTEGGTITKLIELYRGTILLGTPTFLNGIMRATDGSELKTVRLGVTGAEKCSENVYNMIKNKCPEIKIIEGYGITECSPVVSINLPEAAKPYTVGKVIANLEYAIVDENIENRVEKNEKGMLLVRGSSIFDGYIKYDGESPFIEFEGKEWYKTGDLVIEDEDNVLTFAGRLKRFIKLGGEMISMPAIEEVLNKKYVAEEDDGPVIAVEATPSEESPELVLFSVLDIERTEVNSVIADAGLSAIHNIRKIIKVEEIPVLGTGKTDYRSLKEILQ